MQHILPFSINVSCRFVNLVGEIGGFPKSGTVLAVGNFGIIFCGVGGGKDAFDSDKFPFKLI
jgi:hypothetical protein